MRTFYLQIVIKKGPVTSIKSTQQSAKPTYYINTDIKEDKGKLSRICKKNVGRVRIRIISFLFCESIFQFISI